MVERRREGLIPRLVVADLARACAFYEQAFGARPVPCGEAGPETAAEPSLSAEQLEMRLGEAVFYLSRGPAATPAVADGPAPAAPPVVLHLEVEDCDAAVARAVAAGATLVQPPTDMRWGERYGRIRDPFGHSWSFAQSLARPRRHAA